MKSENDVTLRNYIICFVIEAFIAFLVIFSNNFFEQSIAVKIQILSDAFFVPGILMTLFACMLYISGEGALIGIGFVLRNVVLTFIPMGRAKQEKYADYRARKLSKVQKHSDSHILVTGLVFVFIGIVFTVIWYALFYKV